MDRINRIYRILKGAESRLRIGAPHCCSFESGAVEPLSERVYEARRVYQFLKIRFCSGVYFSVGVRRPCSYCFCFSSDFTFASIC